MTGPKNMTGAEVRQKFIDYFVSKGHTFVHSAPLVPGTDKTLLFTNAGMVQFKNVFSGAEKRPYVRAVSSQKCLRVSGKHNDLETVGRTARHHTFFEMLGNFSFGDYFKEEAIKYCWEFMTEVIGLPQERLYATVYTDDDEAAELWAKLTPLPPEHIQRFGEKDNFWSMGETGPCGPCSELHYDRGEEYKCENPDCGIDCECDRFLELWNLVFMQYNRDQSGNLIPLPNPSIDTGMGLERLVSVIQGKESNFETDLLLPIIRAMERLTDEEYGKSAEIDVSFRVIADHVRAATFLVAEGVHPANEGRGYVLRRILRRALRHGMMLGVKEPFAHKLNAAVIQIMKEAYPELAEHSRVIRDVVKAEEESFGDTLEYGMRLLNETMEKVKADGGDTIPGEEAFKLYDTYGFPMDLAQEIAEDRGMKIDMARFEEQMTIQREKARVASRFEPGAEAMLDIGCAATEFKGYDSDEIHEALVLEIYKDGQAVGSAAQGEEVELLLSATPFYAESGGQASDTGVISNESFRAAVVDAKKPDGKHWLHKARVDSGSIKKGDTVTAKIDKQRRRDIRRNHSATHLLHAALREVLGAHVKQAGSLVAAERMRFDYTHFTAPKEAEVKRIERIVNEKIMENLAVATDVKSVEEAVESGAMALFGEKYGDEVRVVTMGDYSKELCGGTHTGATGDIGPFKIVSEGGVAAGVRRIEGVTGRWALDHFDHMEDELAAVGEKIKSNMLDLPLKVGKLAEKSKEQEKEIKRLKEKLLSQGKNDGSDYETTVTELEGVKIITTDLKEEEADFAKGFIDKQRNENKSSVCIVGSRQDDKAIIVVGVTKDITDRCHAGKIIKEVAAIVGGGGGGRPDFAQAGGKNPEKLPDALKAAPGIVKNLLQ